MNTNPRTLSPSDFNNPEETLLSIEHTYQTAKTNFQKKGVEEAERELKQIKKTFIEKNDVLNRELESIEKLKKDRIGKMDIFFSAIDGNVYKLLQEKYKEKQKWYQEMCELRAWSENFVSKEKSLSEQRHEMATLEEELLLVKSQYEETKKALEAGQSSKEKTHNKFKLEEEAFKKTLPEGVYRRISFPWENSRLGSVERNLLYHFPTPLTGTHSRLRESQYLSTPMGFKILPNKEHHKSKLKSHLGIIDLLIVRIYEMLHPIKSVDIIRVLQYCDAWRSACASRDSLFLKLKGIESKLAKVQKEYDRKEEDVKFYKADYDRVKKIFFDRKTKAGVENDLPDFTQIEMPYIFLKESFTLFNMERASIWLSPEEFSAIWETAIKKIDCTKMVDWFNQLRTEREQIWLDKKSASSNIISLGWRRQAAEQIVKEIERDVTKKSNELNRQKELSLQQREKEINSSQQIQLEQKKNSQQSVLEIYHSQIADWGKTTSTYYETDPLLFPINNQAEFSEEAVTHYLQQMAAAAQTRRVMPFIPVGYRRRAIEAGSFVFPVTVPWQTEGSKYNFVIDYTPQEEQTAKTTLNQLLMNMLLAFPIKKLRFHFIDLNITNGATFFTANLDGRLYHNNPLVKEPEMRKKLDELQDRMIEVSKQCENLLDHQRETGEWIYPYEVVVILNYPQGLTPQTVNQMLPLCRNGHKGGIFFVVMRPKNTDEKNILPIELVTPDLFESIPLYRPYTRNSDDWTGYLSPVDEWFTLPGFSYINREAAQKEKIPVLTQSPDKLFKAPLLHAGLGFGVEVGEINKRPVLFELDEINHIHSFVLGQTGSGKSVFLHTLINNALLHYSPDSLQLYLFDFKLGGVEFNRYRDVKHIKALLVDNSDRQITLEIFRSLFASMRERGNLLRRHGVATLREYNEQNPETRLPRIVLVIDECHKLFESRMGKTQSEINNILSEIATEGRSQGVHLVLATQTLADTDIPSKILKNITDHYLLNCSPTDAEKLVPESSRLISELATGRIVQCHLGKRSTFQAFYSDKEQQELLLQMIHKKNSIYPDSDRFFFSGKQIYALNEEIMAIAANRSNRYPLALAGQDISMKCAPVAIPLKPFAGENTLLFGIDTEEQTTRCSVSLFITAMISTRKLEQEYDFVVLNCLDNEERKHTTPLLNKLKSSGCRVVEGNEKGTVIASLAEKVRNHTANKTLLLLLGQERFREVKLEKPITDLSAPTEPSASTLPASGGFLGDMGAIGRGRAEKRTYKSELKYLLENGSEQNVHLFLQVDKPGNLLFENVLSLQSVFSMFKHIIMLKSSSDNASKLRLPEEIKLDTLSDDNERLRAYYYNEETGSHPLFTPFAFPKADQIDKLLNL